MSNSVSVVIIDKEETSRKIIKNYIASISDIYVDKEFSDTFEAYNYVIENADKIREFINE